MSHVRVQSLLLLALASLASVLLAGCGGARILGGAVTASYVGSERCRSCHGQVYADEQDSGHPFKLVKVEGGQAPTFPHSDVPNPPAGHTWNDITYVIGGYGWKARFIDENGYIITGNAVQYNLATRQWVGYEAAVPPGTKPYNCGECHTTGWVATGAAGPNQDGLPGMYGTFSEPGIRCEACHGPGSAHVLTTRASDIVVDTSAEACGQCHFRDTQHRILASGGFIQHREQYDEMIAARHVNLECVSCHHPHRGTRYLSTLGLVALCENCHPAQAARLNHLPGPDCVDCHMPWAAKSAVASNAYRADVRTHIFKINTAAVDKTAMFYSAGGNQYANGFVTLDFACYGCHRDQNGVGGAASQQTLSALSAKAIGIHN